MDEEQWRRPMKLQFRQVLLMLVIVGAASLAACTTECKDCGEKKDTTTTAPSCVLTVALSESNKEFAHTGGTGEFKATIACGTAPATTNDAWINITSGGDAAGTRDVKYTVVAHTGARREGKIKVGDKEYVVTQLAPPPPVCTYVMSGAVTVKGVDGGGGIAVGSAPIAAQCASSASPSCGFVTLKKGSNFGPKWEGNVARGTGNWDFFVDFGANIGPTPRPCDIVLLDGAGKEVARKTITQLGR